MSEEWQHGDISSQIGKWAWILGFINGLIELIYGIYWLVVEISLSYGGYFGISFVSFGTIFYIIGAIIMILISLFIIRPKFSKKCAEKDWDALLDWTLNLGGLRLPWMLIWGIILEIFSWYYWGGLAILIPAFLLLFAGPKEYQWTVEKESS